MIFAQKRKKYIMKCFPDQMTIFSDHVSAIEPLRVQISNCNSGFTTLMVLIYADAFSDSYLNLKTAKPQQTLSIIQT